MDAEEMINVIITLRMTKAEVERDIVPNLTPPPGGTSVGTQTS